MTSPLSAAPTCAAPPHDVRSARQSLPANTCDTQVHVFGLQDRYPLVPGRNYTPHVCTLAQYREVMAALGIERAVLVQPSVYGTDNRALLDALREGGPAFRGIVVPSLDVTDAELQTMHDAGVRGIRLNLVNPQVLGEDEAAVLCQRIAPLGWHLQLQLNLADGNVAPLHSIADKVQIPIVIDHFGRLSPQAPRAGLLEMLAGGRCWLKLSAPYRISEVPLPHGDLAPLVSELLAACPDRLLWGSDWPHTEQAVSTPRASELSDLLMRWIPDAGLRQTICVDNPRLLYGF